MISVCLKLYTKMLIEQALFITIISGCLSSKAPAVVTNSGKIVGHYLTSFKGNRYEAYQGIPYALPPIGDRRFKPPTPAPTWSGELLATHLKSSCWQNSNPSGVLLPENEDCLYLNVFVPRRKPNTTLPVLFWIHGGGFIYGSSVPEEEAYLMDYGVILVTIQYRLGALGFLSTEDEVVPGNMGLKDQSLALRWVHDNIQYFGGDPNKITLYGHSAGGISVHYHYLSPLSAGLFQNGISFSGTAFHLFAHVDNPRQYALALGKLVNCTTSTIEKMVKCLKERPARDLIKFPTNFMPWRPTTSPGPFGPVVENNLKNSFVNSSPGKIIESGKAYDAPWITTVVSEEGLYPAADWGDDILKEINDDWDRIAPFLLFFSDTVPQENLTRLARTIRKHYFGDKPINKDTFMSLIHMIGDRLNIIDSDRAARAQAKANKCPVLFYYYSYLAVDSMSSQLINSTNIPGVRHGDDVFLFMKNTYLIPTKSSRDMAMQAVLIQILTSFASNNSKPDLHVQWSKVNSSDKLKYLKITGPENSNIKMATSDNLGQKKFWNSLNFY